MAVILVFGLFFVIATAHNITLIEVPRFADPRKEAVLVCEYVREKTDPLLHSVKWYKENEEIFRYTPGQEPITRTFNMTRRFIAGSDCTENRCSINLFLPKHYINRIPYTCEVSTEGPRFAFVKQTRNLTVAVLMDQDPVITGMPSSVNVGDEIQLNCSTGLTMPPPTIQWYIDGKPEVGQYWEGNTELSDADENGLRMSWRPLRVKISGSRGVMVVRCEARQPVRPPYVRSANVTLAAARSPHLSMFTASGSNSEQAALALLVGASLHLLCKSAFTGI